MYERARACSSSLTRKLCIQATAKRERVASGLAAHGSTAGPLVYTRTPLLNCRAGSRKPIREVSRFRLPIFSRSCPLVRCCCCRGCGCVIFFVVTSGVLFFFAFYAHLYRMGKRRSVYHVTLYTTCLPMLQLRFRPCSYIKPKKVVRFGSVALSRLHWILYAETDCLEKRL